MENLARQLCATGHEEMLSLNTLEKTNSKRMTPIVTLRVSDVNQEHILEINTVYIRMELPIDLNNMATSVDASGMPHLSSLQLRKADKGKAELLISQFVPEALIPREVISGERGMAFAMKTLLDWTVNGPLKSTCRVTVNALVNFAQSESDIDLSKQLKRLWAIDLTL